MCACCGQVGTGAHHRQHPATGRNDRAIVAPRGSGVQHPLGFGADNDVADPGAPGIVFGRQYHCYGHTVTPPQLAEIGQLPGSGGMKQLAERRLQQGQHGRSPDRRIGS